MGIELLAEEEDDLPNIICVADRLPSNADNTKSVLKEEEGGAVSLQKLQVLVGNREWLKQNGYEITDEVETIVTENEVTGQTVVLAGIEGQHLLCVCSPVVIILTTGVLVGLLVMADTIKSEAHATIYTLQKKRMNVYLLTGDNRHTAQAIAEKVTILV